MKKILFAAFLLVANIAFAKVPNLAKGTYVYDFDHVLSGHQISDLNAGISQIEKKGALQLVIVLIDKLPKGVDINDYTNGIELKWVENGNNKDMDRLIYVAGIDQREHRLIAVTGINSVVEFNRAKCADILTAMKPFFKSSDYNSGLRLLVSNVASTLHITLEPPSRGISGWIMYVFAGIAIVILIGLLLKRRNKQKPVAI